MLSRSNFSIRRFMTQRRQNSDDDLFWDNDEKASSRVTHGGGSPSPSLKVEGRKRQNSRSWMSKPSTKKIPQPIIIVRSSEDLHRITHLPPLPDTPHSSKSSLCSCEQHAAGFASPRRLPRGASPGASPGHGPISSKTYSDRRVSPPPGSPLENPRPSPRLPTDTRKKSVKSLPSPTKLTFDLLEALDIQPDSEEMTTPISIMPPTPLKQKSSPTQDRELEERSDSVQQLIREADEAFDSVGTGLRTEEDAYFDTLAPEEEEGLISPPPTRPAPTPPVRRRPTPLRQTITKKRLSKPALSPLKSPTRSASVSKAKRQKSQKSRNRRQPRPVAKKHRSKWSVNAKDLLTVRLFSRLEVDEVLSPTRLQEIRMSGASQIQLRRSSETLRTIQSDGSDTPVDPFNLQDLPSRIGAAGVRLSIPSPIVEVPTPRTFNFNLVAERKTSSLNHEDNTRTDGPSQSPLYPSVDMTPALNLPEDDAMAFEDVHFPSPPAKNPLRFAPTLRKDLPHLPSIPEVMVTTPENFTLSTSSTRQPPLKRRPEADEPFVYLPSSPYTLTMPTFRHGAIRITKADIALAYSSSKLATAVLDDSLDWTAFHMAILGGAGDLYGEATDYSRRGDREEDEIDDLCEWFGEFGFAGWGRLDRGTKPTSPVTVVEGECSPVSSRSSKSGHFLPIPVEKEFSNGFWHPRSGDEIGTEASSRFDRARSVGLRRWTVEGHPKKYEGMMSIDSSRRPSVDSAASLPQSPMLDLVVSRDSDGNEYIVPMGYNLSHDLGDFLSWEAENVYAAAAFQDEEEGGAELEG